LSLPGNSVGSFLIRESPQERGKYLEVSGMNSRPQVNIAKMGNTLLEGVCIRLT